MNYLLFLNHFMRSLVRLVQLQLKRERSGSVEAEKLTSLSKL